MKEVYCNLKTGETIRIWVKPKVEGRERMFVVYEFRIGWEKVANRKRLKEFGTLEEADAYAKDMTERAKHLKTELSYTIVME